ncbi:signal transduction histidine kinase [Streptomyces sp. 3330]|uniref:sensor histidine kinase n=1 Tax=Streptomyces sp. 3330 TaxID=2817755 RepID=UPI002860D6C4|nr:HAMP domain-containing sensor histidine kinase [Streptomyces sp. 3330]MDR6976915.1 signal transduction histidine kinase [Streptomyces sp. 3330]
MNRRFGSVRARATLGATCVVAVALLAAGTAVLLSLRSSLTGQADGQAERSARTVAAQLALGTPYDRLSSLDDDERVVQVVDAHGAQVAATEDLERISGAGTRVASSGEDEDTGDDPSEEPGEDPVEPAGGDAGEKASGAPGEDAGDGAGEAAGGGGLDDDPGEDPLAPGEVGDETRSGDGSATVDGDTADYRFAAVDVRDPKKGLLTVYAGASLAAERSAVRTALTVLLIGFPLLLAVVAGVTWLVTRRALRPVEDIRRELAAITAAAELTRRVPEPDTHDEVARLARTTNETLTALETSVERRRRFVADASHELRSPIASLRTQLEVGLAHPGLLDVAGAVEDTVRLQRLAADLLLLARLDAGEGPVAGARVDLAALAREEAAGRPDVEVEMEADVTVAVEADAGRSASGRSVSGEPVSPESLSESAAPECAASERSPLEVAGSRGQLGRVLANLLDNAHRHARSAVTVTVRRADGQAVVEVADDGDGVPEADRERIFERFVRLDDARGRDDGGAGLGLAIARDVAVRHGGTLTVRETPTGGALFELRLPTA